MRSFSSVLLAVFVLGLFPLAGAAVATDFNQEAEAQFVAAINDSRADAGLPALVVNAELIDVARAWSVKMDVADLLSHNPSYAQEYSGHWIRMGENVGTATWPGASTTRMVENLHQAFMNSPGHHANIVGNYNQVGVGVLSVGNTMWVTVNFLSGDIPADVLDLDLPVVERIEIPGLQGLAGGGEPVAEELAEEEPAEDAVEIPVRDRSPVGDARHFTRF